MATTDPSLIGPVLAALRESAARGAGDIALLHNESSAAVGMVTSDVDVVTNAALPDLVDRVTDAVAPIGIKLVVLWNYDVGAWTTVWTRDPSEGGFQLDLWNDPAGLGAYGVQTDLLLRHTLLGDRYPRLSDKARTSYLIQKRMLKEDWQELSRLIDFADENFTWGELSAFWNARANLTREGVLRAIDGESRGALWRSRRLLRLRQAQRIAARIRSRTGVLIHAEGDAAAAAQSEIASLVKFVPVSPKFADGMQSYNKLWRLRLPTILVQRKTDRLVHADAAVCDVAAPTSPDQLSQAAHDVLKSRLRTLLRS